MGGWADEFRQFPACVSISGGVARTNGCIPNAGDNYLFVCEAKRTGTGQDDLGLSLSVWRAPEYGKLPGNCEANVGQEKSGVGVALASVRNT